MAFKKTYLPVSDRRMVTYHSQNRRFMKPRVPRIISRQNTGNGSRFFKISRVISTGLPGNLLSVTNNPNDFTDWSNIQALFQFYKPHAIKLTWVPYANTKEMASSEILQQHPIYIVHDWNPVNTAVTEQFMLGHEKLTIKNSLDTWSYYKRLVAALPTTLAAQGSLFSGYLQTQIPVATNQILMWNPGPQIDGRLIVSLFLTAKYRQ